MEIYYEEKRRISPSVKINLSDDSVFKISGGEKITAKIMFGHDFPFPDILIKKEDLGDFYYIGPDGHKKEITNTWEEKIGKDMAAADKMPVLLMQNIKMSHFQLKIT